MNQLLPAIAILFILTGCRKFDLEKQIPPEEIQIYIVAEHADENICPVLPTAEFPGGTAAWHQFLQQTLTYPETAIDADIQGTVIVQFVVNTDGTLSNIEAIHGPDELKESAVEVLKKSPNWIPADINGRNIKGHIKLPILFRLEVE
jgi:periplasmic protein TonB